jgi:preprotein translocase subunit SecA
LLSPNAAQRILAKVRRLDFSGHSGGDLRTGLTRLKIGAQRLDIEEMLAQAFGIVDQAITRQLDLRPTGEQLLAGVHLFDGSIAQLNAGEGKTIAAAFPAVAHALLGRSVHTITANDYLASRDADLLSPVYQSLGIRVGSVLGYMEDDERRQNYGKDVVYGTMREFGFDFLRDNLKTGGEERVQGKLEAAIIDEVDHALIDEAFTPMIISGSPLGNRGPVTKVKRAVGRLIDRQSEIARGLADQLAQPGVSLREKTRIMAQLLLAEPDNPALKQCLAAEPGLFKRTMLAAESDSADLTPGLLYVIAADKRFVTLTEQGREVLVQQLGPFYDGRPLEERLETLGASERLTLGEQRRLAAAVRRRLARQYNLGNQVYQMLRACLLLHRDVDYLVTEDQLVLIDRATGRPKVDCVYQNGLQSAVEAREGITPRPETETLGQISVEGFVKRYQWVSGMTGTATTSTGEFRQRYGLKVVELPPARPVKRVDLGYRVYLNKQQKVLAIIDEVAASHRVGQPVLVGTLTVEDSHELSRLLSERGIPHNLLSAVSCEAEARIVREAGAFGAVTVATNMAGRGTDILLEPGLDARITERCASLAAQDRPDFSLGLRVIGTEINDSPRIDLQLSGRSGRQGNFGVTQTLLSLEDRLLNLHVDGVLKLKRCRKVDAAGLTYFAGQPVDSHIKVVQRMTEREAEVQRSLLQDYTAVLDRQTDLFYQHRRQAVASASFKQSCTPLVQSLAGRLVAGHFAGVTSDLYPSQFARFADELRLDYDVDCSSFWGLDLTTLPAELGQLFIGRLEGLEREVGPANFDYLAILLYRNTCDELWKSQVCELQDSFLNQTLSSSSHKSAVAHYIRRSFKAWDEFLELVEADYLSRLLTFPVDWLHPPVLASVQVHEDARALIARQPIAMATAGRRQRSE